jgi:hypothetical protein
LQINGVGHQHVQETSSQRLDQLLQQRQRASHFGLAALLKTNAEGDGKVAADDGDQTEAMIVLDVFAQISIDLVFYLPFHAVGTAAEVGAANLDTVDGGDHQAPRPGGGEHAIAFELPGDGATHVEQGGGILPLQHIADIVLAEGADAMAEHAFSTFRLDAMEGTVLASAAEEDGIEDGLGGNASIVAAIGQRLYPMREVKHLIEPNLELVPAQSWGA